MSIAKDQKRLYKIAERYDGPLNAVQVAEGIAEVKANVGQMVSAAAALATARIYSLSCAYSLMAVEEAQKVSVLRNLLLSDDPDEIKSLWKDFRTHTRKHLHFAIAIASQALVHGEIPPDDAAIEKKIAECPDPQTLEELKQGLIYCDCVKDYAGLPSWSNPASIGDWGAPHAERLLASAREALDHIHLTAPEELAIWKKHVAPNRFKPIKELLECVDRSVTELNALGFHSGSN